MFEKVRIIVRYFGLKFKQDSLIFQIVKTVWMPRINKYNPTQFLIPS